MKKRKYNFFDVLNMIFMLFIVFVTAYPVYYVIVASISNPMALSRETSLLLLPLKPYTIEAYKSVFSNSQIVIGFRNTLFILVVGVSFNMIMTSLGAYFLTLNNLMLKNAVAFMIIFTMYFSGGLIPAYLNIKDLGMLNTIWSLIVPGAVNTTNLLIMKSAFQAIPNSLLESAKLDGASHFQILRKIMIPLSKATMAVLVLYYAVGHWNAWFSASIYIRDKELYPLQLVMRNILYLAGSLEMAGNASADELSQYAELVKYALIVVTTFPIVVLYPFLQKYFVKGVMIGAVKG